MVYVLQPLVSRAGVTCFVVVPVVQLSVQSRVFFLFFIFFAACS